MSKTPLAIGCLLIGAGLIGVLYMSRIPRPHALDVELQTAFADPAGEVVLKEESLDIVVSYIEALRERDEALCEIITGVGIALIGLGVFLVAETTTKMRKEKKS
jgi:hypothetical protein